MYICINIGIFQLIPESNYKYQIKYYAFLFNLNNINCILFIFFHKNRVGVNA